MTAEALMRECAEQGVASHAVYPALLRAAYGGDPVTISPADALALLALFDALEELARRDGDVDQLTARLAGQSPALDRWRALVLESPAKHAPLAVAAAWEAHALDLERHDNAWLAHRARLAAAQILVAQSPPATSHAA